MSDVIKYQVPNGKLISQDNGIRVSSLEKLSKLKPAFIKPHGTVTAASSSFLTDGASACLLTTAEKAKAMGLKPKVALKYYGYVALEPKQNLLMGPLYVTAKFVKQFGLKLEDIDVFEIHEAFAAQVLSNLKVLRPLKNIFF